MTIEWRDAMSIGDEVIDEDHQNLIRLINKYEMAIVQKNPRELENAFNGLVDYAHAHFEREERVMEAVYFPHRRKHAEHHRDLLHRIEDFHKSLSVDHKLDLKATSSFLHDWLINHVLDEDMQIKPHLTGDRSPRTGRPAG